uniref:Uncharacterized protein n=1 Tax=Lepeophtheirus salmonis TaxID=72036 RepID=A0A0K2TLK7_LEPSM
MLIYGFYERVEILIIIILIFPTDSNVIYIYISLNRVLFGYNEIYHMLKTRDSTSDSN